MDQILSAARICWPRTRAGVSGREKSALVELVDAYVNIKIIRRVVSRFKIKQ
jgi:hypothetical protein